MFFADTGPCLWLNAVSIRAMLTDSREQVWRGVANDLTDTNFDFRY